jgi:ABC-type nickel/cobalt efflux system permease component RcnA
MTDPCGGCQLTLVAPHPFHYISGMLKKALLPIALIFAAIIVLAGGAWWIVVKDPFNRYFPSEHDKAHHHSHEPGDAACTNDQDHAVHDEAGTTNDVDHAGHDHDDHEGHNH